MGIKIKIESVFVVVSHGFVADICATEQEANNALVCQGVDSGYVLEVKHMMEMPEKWGEAIEQ